MGTKQHNNRTLDVRKDRLDLRDREYRPILKSLPKYTLMWMILRIL